MTAAGLHALRVALTHSRGLAGTWCCGDSCTSAGRLIRVNAAAVHALAREGLVELFIHPDSCTGYRVTDAGRKACEERGVSCDCGAAIDRSGASMCVDCERTTVVQ